MHLKPKHIHAKADRLHIEGPQGCVIAWRKNDVIHAQYAGSQLVNGSAQAYADRLLSEAIELTKGYPLPWYFDATGKQRITDHDEFFRQTFDPSIRGIERLLIWIQKYQFVSPFSSSHEIIATKA